MIDKFEKICPNCYWHDGKRCEIFGEDLIYRNCYQYLNDYHHSRRVKEWLKYEPEKAKRNWNLLDEIDRRKYLEMYGDRK